MAAAGNACADLLGHEKPVPFTSSLMDNFTSFRDMCDPEKPGTRYNASGCLIHGLSVVADSLVALKSALRQWDAETIRGALVSDFESDIRLREFLAAQPKT